METVLWGFRGYGTPPRRSEGVLHHRISSVVFSRVRTPHAPREGHEMIVAWPRAASRGADVYGWSRSARSDRLHPGSHPPAATASASSQSPDRAVLAILQLYADFGQSLADAVGGAEILLFARLGAQVDQELDQLAGQRVVGAASGRRLRNSPSRAVSSRSVATPRRNAASRLSSAPAACSKPCWSM